MNALRNQVTLVGNLGNDIEVRTLASERTVAKVSLATNLYYKTKAGEERKETQWHNLVAWGKLGQNMANILKKGEQVMVQGKLTYRSYEDSAGTKHYITEIIVNDFMKLSKASKSEEVTA